MTPAARARALRWLPALLVLLLGLAPRVLWLDRAPPALHPDEAATAADACELFARPALSFAHERGGWVEGTYVWAAAPGLALARRAGWSLEAAARAPAALAGVALLCATFALGRALGGRGLGTLATLCLALAPWGWHFSRLALRGTLVPALAVGGLALWASAERGPRARARPRLLAGGLLLALAAATYPPARLVLPAVAALFLATAPPRAGERAWLPLGARDSALALGPVVLVFLALLPWTLWGAGAERLDEVALPGGIWARTAGAGRGWLLHFLPRHLFSGASSRGFAPEGVGLIPRWQAPLLVLGLGALLLERDRLAARLLGLLALSPVAAAFTRDVPTPLRASLELPALALVAGWGALRLWWGLRGSPRLRAALALTLAVAGGLSAANDLRGYFLRHPAREARFYYAGRRELVREAARRHARGQSVRVEEEFLAAYLRLYAPTLPARRLEGERWVLGGGAPAARLAIAADPLRVVSRPP
ncbi:MAG: hypothetical protein AB7N76_07870 [Planctomycetota bacterium]